MVWSRTVSIEGFQSRPDRQGKHLIGFLRRPGRNVEPATFEDVSDQGCSLMGELSIGEHLIVMLPKIGTRAAQVRWSIGGRAGLQFTEMTSGSR